MSRNVAMIIVLSTMFLLIGGNVSAFAPMTKTFGESTHPLMTRTAFMRAGITNIDLEGAAADGTIEEDTGPDRMAGCFIRAFNHFYDPQHRQPFTCKTSLNVFQPSFRWLISKDAQMGIIPFSAISNVHVVLNCPKKDYPNIRYPGGDASWQSSLDWLHNNDPSDGLTRVEKLRRAYKGLGHALHLLQDSGVPDHARGDDHPAFLEGAVDPSVLEQWAKAPGRVSELEGLVKYPTMVSDPVSAIKLVSSFASSTFYSYSTVPPASCASFKSPLNEAKEKDITISAETAKLLGMGSIELTYKYEVVRVRSPGRVVHIPGISGLDPDEIPICRPSTFHTPVGSVRVCFVDNVLVNHYTWRVIGTLVVEASWGLVEHFSKEQGAIRIEDNPDPAAPRIPCDGRKSCLVGPESYWHSVTTGSAGHSWTTKNNDGQCHPDSVFPAGRERRIENYAVWRLSAPFESNYVVQAYVPPVTGLTKKARYSVCVDGRATCYQIDQAAVSASADSWVDLGIHQLTEASSARVAVHDLACGWDGTTLSCERYGTTAIGVDAVRFRPTAKPVASVPAPANCLPDEIMLCKDGTLPAIPMITCP
ncbi:MAG: hypothetical protein JNJ46_16820 [Myxococcales bacterium]|nr:hypothetical protein [Myxococcales bacterium]